MTSNNGNSGGSGLGTIIIGVFLGLCLFMIIG